MLLFHFHFLNTYLFNKTFQAFKTCQALLLLSLLNSFLFTSLSPSNQWIASPSTVFTFTFNVEFCFFRFHFFKHKFYSYSYIYLTHLSIALKPLDCLPRHSVSHIHFYFGQLMTQSHCFAVFPFKFSL